MDGGAGSPTIPKAMRGWKANPQFAGLAAVPSSAGRAARISFRRPACSRDAVRSNCFRGRRLCTGSESDPFRRRFPAAAAIDVPGPPPPAVSFASGCLHGGALPADFVLVRCAGAGNLGRVFRIGRHARKWPCVFPAVAGRSRSSISHRIAVFLFCKGIAGADPDAVWEQAFAALGAKLGNPSAALRDQTAPDCRVSGSLQLADRDFDQRLDEVGMSLSFDLCVFNCAWVLR